MAAKVVSEGTGKIKVQILRCVFEGIAARFAFAE
jgi:hypothetical protein